MKFSIYKRGQGKYTRLCTAFMLAAIVILGCLRLYQQLEAASWEISKNAHRWIETLVPVGVALVFTWLIFWVVNTPKLADFMVDAEGEMKKVSWSSRKEIVVSTTVVVAVVAIMAVFLGLVDLGFVMFFENVVKI